MLPIHVVEQKLEFVSSELRDIVIEIRNLVAEIAKDAVEVTHSKGFTYYHKGKGGPVSAGICQTAIYPGCVRLAFIHGAFIADPKGYLQGERLAKRYLELKSYDQIPWEDIKDLIQESSDFDPRNIVNFPL
jgi:hypothetical protein